MVIRPAASGGYSIVSLLDTSEQRPLLSRRSLLVLSGVVSAHLLALAYLHGQSFDRLAPIEAPPEPPAVVATFTTLEPDKVPPKTSPTPRTNAVHTPRQTPTDTPPATTQPPPTQQTRADGPPTVTSDPPQPPFTPQPPRVIRDPDWLSVPTADEMADAYPARALSLGWTGQIVLACAVTAAGALSDCAVVEESPAHDGFGAAALKLSKRFRMSPRSVDGQPVGGAQVRIPIRFTLPN